MLLFTNKLVTDKATVAKQFASLQANRASFNINEKRFAGEMAQHNLSVNSGQIPRDVYREFDNVTVERMRSDDGDKFLNPLMGLTKAVNIGKLIYETRRASDAGQVQTSMSGQTGVKFDQVEYNYDGVPLPIHDCGFTRNWREFNAQRSEGFDALIDDQRESVAAVRRRLADSFLDGHRDKNNQIIVGPDGRKWEGMRNDARVNQVDLGAGGLNFDFTDPTKTGEEIKAAFIQLRDVLYITNNCEQDATYYVSREIMSNFERRFSNQYDSRLTVTELGSLMGVANIEASSKLTGNEIMAFPLDGSVTPVSGMGMSTMAMPRQVYNANYDFVVATATGWYVKQDYFGRSCALYASS